MSKWITYDEAKEAFGVEPVDLRHLVRSGRVRTQRENRVQMFEAEDVMQAVGQTSPQVAQKGAQTQTLEAPVDDKVDAGDVEQALASDMSRELGGDKWMTYQELLDDYQVRRGWLDRMILEEKVHWRMEGRRTVYLWGDIEPYLGDETARILAKSRAM